MGLVKLEKKKAYHRGGAGEASRSNGSEGRRMDEGEGMKEVPIGRIE